MVFPFRTAETYAAGFINRNWKSTPPKMKIIWCRLLVALDRELVDFEWVQRSSSNDNGSQLGISQRRRTLTTSRRFFSVLKERQIKCPFAIFNPIPHPLFLSIPWPFFAGTVLKTSYLKSQLKSSTSASSLQPWTTFGLCTINKKSVTAHLL